MNMYSVAFKSLTVFRGILADETIAAFVKLLSDPTAEKYGGFLYSLYEHTDNFTAYLLKIVTEDENTFMRRLAAFEEVPEHIEKAAKHELEILQKLSQLTPDEIKRLIPYGTELLKAGWKTEKVDFTAAYTERMSELSTKGFGIFAKYHTFTLKNGKIVPIKNPDPQTLSQLSGYALERGKVVNNTLALLNGKPAANVLLYGDAGTGKSSTVKAVVNEYRDMGLRLIELKKQQLEELPVVIDKIAKNPLKFIIFVDDISFSSDDDSFSTLKAVLEGSVATKTANAVIYATSNRRHLVKERFSDRDGDDIHAGDTREELISLSERFGLKVAFLKPNKEIYLEIVRKLAEEYGVEFNDELCIKAEAFALRRNGRSGRAAKHFIESIKAEM
ncbi:MAG: DUF815 domain-containing protein [Oscillospiraceae bacterium]|nr:DUF815 domain-containing protein [Oscillospiraceae bacterium]